MWIFRLFCCGFFESVYPELKHYLPVTCPNIDEFLFLPVALGYWKQYELWDGTYTLDDLLDIAELAEVRRENETRAAFAARGVKGVR